jgi:hypothetical protein
MKSSVPGRQARLQVFAAALLAAGALAVAALTAPAAAGAATATQKPPPVVGKLYVWVPHMPASVHRDGAPLEFTFEVKQTSHYRVWLQFYLGTFVVHNTASAHSQTRGIRLRYYDPVSKRWLKPMLTDPTSGWTLGPAAGITISRDKVLRIRVKMWFSNRAWLGLYQVEPQPTSWQILNSSGQGISASLDQHVYQYQFTVRR